MRQEWTVNKQKIICNDCVIEMSNMPEESIDVVVTSPPYNLNIDYNEYKDNLDPDAYSAWIYVVFEKIKRLLKDDGSFFLNVGGSCKNPYIAMDLCQLARNAGWVLQNNIIWVKSITVNDNSYGHFKPVNSNRFLNNQHESIFHFTKSGEVGLDRLSIGTPYQDKSNVTRWEHAKADVRCRGNTWFIPYKTVQKRKEHPAGFPVELVLNCVKLAGIKENMVVLDIFLGCGTTLCACQELDINGIGIEIDSAYCDLSRERLEESADGKIR